ncbi:hypothetical protein BCR35DRAFT_335773 [Leucosporidium creatinivorum]|uniref:Myb-like domain-containing protein n=1 Tax=Leucosporidium creatinivorum TaxID=106004 RepID=A0A1Y2D5A8_9BASI|nr:hypothetical protein BCR35DRAFT_335773 [Leucosporidium creatinivorum]
MARLGVFEQDQVLKRYVELSELHHYLKAARFFGTEHHRDDLVGPLPNPDSAPWGNKEETALLKASRKCKDAPSRLRVEMGNGRSLRCLTSRLKEIDPDGELSFGWLAALDGKLEQTEKRVPGKATWRRIGKEMRAEYQGCPYTAIEVKARWDRVYGLKGVLAAAPRRASVDSSSHPSTPPEASITPSSIAKAPTPSAPSAAPTTKYSPSTTARASSPCPQPKPPFPSQTGPWSDQENNLLYQLLDNGLPITPSSVHKKLKQRIKYKLGHQRKPKDIEHRLRAAVYHSHFLPATATYSHLPRDGDYIGPKPSPDMIAWSAEEDAELLRLWQLPLQHQETSSGDRIAHVQTLFGSGRSRAGMMDRLSKLGAIAAKETPMDLDPLPSSAPPHPPTPGLFDFAAFFVSTPFPNLQKSNGDFDVGRRLLEG